MAKCQNGMNRHVRQNITGLVQQHDKRPLDSGLQFLMQKYGLFQVSQVSWDQFANCFILSVCETSCTTQEARHTVNPVVNQALGLGLRISKIFPVG